MKPTVIVLEDEQYDQDWIGPILEEEGYAVIFALNGDEMKIVLEKEKANIVLAVVDMKINGSIEQNFGEVVPNKRGVAAAKYIQDNLGYIPVIFASAYGKEGVKNIAENAKYTGPWAYFDKEVLRAQQSTILREAVRLAVQRFDDRQKYLTTGIDVLQVMSSHNGFRFNFNVADNNVVEGQPVFSRQVFKKNELNYIRSIGGGLLKIALSNEHSFTVSMTPARFRTQYQSFLEFFQEDDFLIEGVSLGNAIWINPENIKRYNSASAYFLQGEDISINTALKQGLDRIFPVFGA